MRLIISWILRFGIIELFLAFFVSVNILTFVLYVIDKRQAVKNKWRISECILIFFTLSCGGIGAFIATRFTKHKMNTRIFKFARLVGLIIALIPMVHIAHGFTLDKIIRYVEIDFHSANWPAELNGYRIAFMTDMHIIADESMRRVAMELNERNINLLLLGGDFSVRNEHYQGTIREIAQIFTTDGIFGVEGNHDDYIRLFRAKEQYGIIPLDNNGTHIREGFYLAGVQDLWNRNPNVVEAVYGAYTDDFVLLLSHNPDVSMQQSTSGIDLILSGHTHSGQITFFGFSMQCRQLSVKRV